MLFLRHILDDDAYLDQPPDLKAPGTIRVQMYRVQVTGQGPWHPHHLPKTSSIVHERSKKAGGHITQFGKQGVTRRASKSLSTKPYAPADVNPWVTFEFRYRPAAILQAEGIMPKPQAARIENQVRGGDVEKMETQQEAETRVGQVKQAEPSERRAALKVKARNPKVKREGYPFQGQRSTVVEVIDLTLEYEPPQASIQLQQD
ncbi:hypothetical protein FRC01_004472 [Tulasnella sp. 417]|nr:hypothetical protein FRC01_004472 [Tulasnella sp. 417]